MGNENFFHDKKCLCFNLHVNVSSIHCYFWHHRLPDVYTEFRKAVEGGCKVRSCVDLPDKLNPLPAGVEEGDIPSMTDLGVEGRLILLALIIYHCLLVNLVVECLIRVLEVPDSISQSRTASYQRR